MLNSDQWVITKSGYLKVKGSTTVNTFTCVIPNYARPDTINIYRTKSVVKLSGEIALNINAFDCHNVMMTAQLRKTLKAAQYPHIKIRFISLNKLPILTSKKEQVKGWVEIVLANVTKRYEIDYQLYKDAQNTIHLTGVQDVNFSDFKLIPPSKLGGMIKTNDQLGIEFQLQFKEI
ncbi:YceI family protein [Pedobacter alpinus]|uniref:YceI family protein n=1 Tax=Pedobacter alpinus TaxID=1590643 RepID=A0ABW5TSR6_9SPHI